ncbi:hypothetical protein D3C78_1597170 [compost metagenome]
MAVGAGPFQLADMHGAGVRGGDGQAPKGAVNYLVVGVCSDRARASVPEAATFEGEPVKNARGWRNQVIVDVLGIEQHVQVFAQKVADYVVFQPQGLDLLSERNRNFAVFTNDQLGTVLALEGFVKADPGRAAGVEAQA